MGYIGSKPTNKPLTSADIEDGVISAADLGANSVDSSELVDGSVDNSHMSVNSIDSDQYVDGSIDNAHLANDAVDTQEIADNAITLAKMAGGTDGNIISYDASGNPVAIATGSDGEVLTSAGAGQPPAFEAVSAGTALTGSTNNTIPTVTGANAISGEANLTFDGTDLTLGTGNIVLGTGGKGIYLGVTTTTAANHLDDYEEGQFTSTIIGTTGSAGTYAYSGGISRYTKIGRIICVHGSGVCTNKGSYSGTAKITGLPFTGNDAPSSMSFGNFPINSDISGGGYPKSFGITIGYQQDFMNCHCGNWWDSQIDWADIDTGRSFTFSGVYEDATGS